MGQRRRDDGSRHRRRNERVSRRNGRLGSHGSRGRNGYGGREEGGIRQRRSKGRRDRYGGRNRTGSRHRGIGWGSWGERHGGSKGIGGCAGGRIQPRSNLQRSQSQAIAGNRSSDDKDQ